MTDPRSPLMSLACGKEPSRHELAALRRRAVTCGLAAASLHAYGLRPWLERQFDGGLRQLTDIAAVLRHHGSTLDWHKVVLCAEAWHAERCLSLCLATARDLLRVHVPQVVFDRLTMPGDRWQRVARELCLGNHYTELAQWLPVLARFWIDKRWRGLSRLARWRECLMPARASLRHVYPRLKRGRRCCWPRIGEIWQATYCGSCSTATDAPCCRGSATGAH